MKKVIFLFCALMLVASFVAPVFAEVQNVKVSGDVRLRGYTQDKIPTLTEDSERFGYVEQRVRVKVESDLTDNVSAVARIAGNDVWGRESTDEFNAAFEEAYMVLKEAMYEPLTLKLGRQYIHYGTGMLISAEQEAYVFDAAKATLNFDPVSVDGIWIKGTETMAVRDDVDAFVGAVTYAQEKFDVQFLGIKQTDDSVANEEPIWLSLRGDLKATEALGLFGEIIRLDGEAEDVDFSAWAANLGGTFSFATDYSPVVKAEVVWGQGDDKDAEKNFVETSVEDRYYGFVYSPSLTNIYILNLMGSVKPTEKTKVALDYYHYMQDEEIAMAMGDVDQDNGGISAVTNGTDSNLGDEIDVILSYDYTKDVLTSLYAGWFFAGDAYASTNDDTAFEVRGEIKVLF